MKMKKTTLIANLAIAVVLCLLSIAIFSADLGRVYESVAAPVALGNKNHKNVSFVVCVETDTDGAALDEIMNVLALRKVNATFFVTGSWVMRNPQRVKTLHNMGFELGNHGFAGKSLRGLDATKQKAEMLDTHTLVKGLTGFDMKLFLPPKGEFNNSLLKVAKDLGYVTIAASRDVSSHSPDATADRIFNRATENMKNGELIKICPSRLVAQAMPSIINSYLQADFRIIKVSENIGV
jgi:peptidoglycan/xylan/chitin deacetylase (PgdA/CDA1 family)